MEKDLTILGIESSCDETAASVVRNGREVLSSVVSTQILVHRKFGGVVPEIASRKHIEHVMPVIDEALKKAHLGLTEIDAIAVTYGPGLVGALLVGLSAAKGLALGTLDWSQSLGRACFCQFSFRSGSKTAFFGLGCVWRSYLPACCGRL